jgi:DUF4097 and DUF4098 domain-containing protein YvlB
MSHALPRRPLVALLTALVLTGVIPLAGCVVGRAGAVHQQTTTFSVPHTTGAGLKVYTRNGSIVVRQADGPDVTVEARLAMTSELRLQQTTISARRNAAGFLEVAATPPGGRWDSNEGCSFEILIPDTAGLDLRSGNGRIELSDLGGHATLHTSNGRIIVRGHDGEISAHTSNGPVRLEEFTGPAKVRTSNGAVTLSPAPSCPGPLDVRTSNGAISLNLPASATERALAGRMELHTSNGSINIARSVEARLNRAGRSFAEITLGDAPGAGTSQLRTSNGSIAIR